MVKVEPDSGIDGVINGGFTDKELDILSILDFPIESLGGDEFADDWDVSKFHCLDPIPSDLLESSVLPHNQVRPPFLSSVPTVPVDEISKPEPQTKQFSEASDPSSVRRHVPRFYQSPSPVSVLHIRKGTRSKRAKPTGRTPWFSTSPIVVTSLASKKKYNRIIKRAAPSSKRTKNPNQPSLVDSNRPPQNPTDGVKMCSHCQSTETPQWREGPMGPQTLCNACGVRYRTGRLFPEYRPASSPSFVPSIHSNCHKKVMEMRNRAKQIH